MHYRNFKISIKDSIKEENAPHVFVVLNDNESINGSNYQKLSLVINIITTSRHLENTNHLSF